MSLEKINDIVKEKKIRKYINNEWETSDDVNDSAEKVSNGLKNL